MYHVDMNHFLELRKQIFINETFITLEVGEENQLNQLRLRFLRLSTIKKGPQMLRSTHRELRNSKVKLGWVVVVVVVVGV